MFDTHRLGRLELWKHLMYSLLNLNLAVLCVC